MIDEYGFLYYRAPAAGVALPIADKNETWLMEIFGPGEDWTPKSNKPGGVWCAQRIPDGEVGCSANRSRIGKVNLKDSDQFIASGNIFSLAKELGFWKPDEPFLWYNVYGGPGSEYNSLREWRALSLAAPSLGLTVSGDPAIDRYPFSVRPDKPITVGTLMSIMRDSYEGTLPDSWNQPANFTRIDRNQPQWNFRLAHNLVNNLRYQDALQDVRRVVQPAEDQYLDMQTQLEDVMLHVFEQHGKQATEALLTDHAHACLSQVATTYDALVDYLMLRYLIGDKEMALPRLPTITVPSVPETH